MTYISIPVQVYVQLGDRWARAIGVAVEAAYVMLEEDDGTRFEAEYSTIEGKNWLWP